MYSLGMWEDTGIPGKRQVDVGRMCTPRTDIGFGWESIFFLISVTTILNKTLFEDLMYLKC